MTESVRGEIEDGQTISITFTYSIGADGKSIVSDVAFTEDRIRVEEEDRGDYGAWK